LELDLVNVRCTWMTSLHPNKSAGKVYWGYLSKKHFYFLRKYIKSVFGPVPCYLYIYCSQITLLQQKKNYSPNHDTGGGSVNNHRTSRQNCLQRLRMATALPQCGLNYNVDDCKYHPLLDRFQLKLILIKYCDKVDLTSFPREKSRRKGILRKIETLVSLESKKYEQFISSEVELWCTIYIYTRSSVI